MELFNYKNLRYNTSKIRNYEPLNKLGLLFSRCFGVLRFSIPLDHLIYSKHRIKKLVENCCLNLNFLNFHSPLYSFVQFRKSSSRQAGQLTQLYLLYHTPSSEGSRRKQKQRFVPFTLSQMLKLCLTLSTRIVWRLRSLTNSKNIASYTIILVHIWIKIRERF